MTSTSSLSDRDINDEVSSSDEVEQGEERIDGMWILTMNADTTVPLTDVAESFDIETLFEPGRPALSIEMRPKKDYCKVFFGKGDFSALPAIFHPFHLGQLLHASAFTLQHWPSTTDRPGLHFFADGKGRLIAVERHLLARSAGPREYIEPGIIFIIRRAWKSEVVAVVDNPEAVRPDSDLTIVDF